MAQKRGGIIRNFFLNMQMLLLLWLSCKKLVRDGFANLILYFFGIVVVLKGKNKKKCCCRNCFFCKGASSCS